MFINLKTAIEEKELRSDSVNYTVGDTAFINLTRAFFVVLEMNRRSSLGNSALSSSYKGNDVVILELSREALGLSLMCNA